jgi:hypothetical protein
MPVRETEIEHFTRRKEAAVLLHVLTARVFFNIYKIWDLILILSLVFLIR